MDKNIDKLDQISCFTAHAIKKRECKNKKCRYWHDIKNEESKCILNIIDKKESYTLQEVGDLFDITRMRICQIEKHALEKIKKNLTFI